MKKYILQLCGLAVVSIAVYSCKLDKPILPGDPGYVAQYPPTGGNDSTVTKTGTGSGTGTAGTGIDTSLLTGSWKVKITYSGAIQDGVYNEGVQSPVALIPDVDMNSNIKVGVFGADVSQPDSLSYTSSISNKKFYITFATDPFPRSANGPIQVSALSSSSMTWIAIDPQVLTSGGHTLQTAITVVFSK